MSKLLNHARSALVVPAMLALSACGDEPDNTGQSAAMKAAQERAKNAQIYIPKNAVELANYNKRQEMADDPTTIIWCTSAFPVPGSPFITMPVVGKLTSGNKRPYPTAQTWVGDTTGKAYYPELPGPDQMYGSSGEYRFGFSPAGIYVDFYQISTFCTSEPLVWQTQETKIVMQVDERLAAVQKEARKAMAAGRSSDGSRVTDAALAKAYDILNAGIDANP